MVRGGKGSLASRRRGCPIPRLSINCGDRSSSCMFVASGNSHWPISGQLMIFPDFQSKTRNSSQRVSLGTLSATSGRSPVARVDGFLLMSASPRRSISGVLKFRPNGTKKPYRAVFKSNRQKDKGPHARSTSSYGWHGEIRRGFVGWFVAVGMTPA